LSYYTKHLYQSSILAPFCISMSKKIRSWIRFPQHPAFFRWAPLGSLVVMYGDLSAAFQTLKSQENAMRTGGI
ncbi:hypothetical protein K443DRAFT_108456, partial [Laccaria amethystina LaAM-08-1]